MDKEIIAQWERANKTLEEIRDAINPPKPLLDKILEYGGSGVGILGIVFVIDIVKNWIGG